MIFTALDWHDISWKWFDTRKRFCVYKYADEVKYEACPVVNADYIVFKSAWF